EPLLVEIVQRIDEVLWNIRRFAYSLQKAFPLRPRQSFDLLEYLFGSPLNFDVSRIIPLFQAIAIIRQTHVPPERSEGGSTLNFFPSLGSAHRGGDAFPFCGQAGELVG